MGLSKASQRGLMCLAALTALLLVALLFALQQHRYHSKSPTFRNGTLTEISLAYRQEKMQQSQLTRHRWVSDKPKAPSMIVQAAGKNQHIDDLRTSWGNNNLLIRQQQQNHHSISIGKDNDMFPISAKFKEQNNAYRFNYWITRHRRHHHGKGGGVTGHGKAYGKGEGKGYEYTGKGKGKGKGESDNHCLGVGGSYKSKSKRHGKGGQGSSQRKHGSGKGKGKRTLKGKSGYGKGKGDDGKGHGKGGKGKGGKGKGGKGKGGKGKGGDSNYDDDEDDYSIDDECSGHAIRPPSSLNDIIPIIAPPPSATTVTPPVLVPIPITITSTPIATPTATTTDAPVSVVTNAPSVTSTMTTTTGPTPERDLVSVRVSDWYVAFRAPDATTRSPTREEYELILEGTRVYLEMYFQNYFTTNMLENVIYVRTDSLLGNAAYGLDVPVFVPQPSMVDNERVNIYVQFRYVEFFYVDTSTPIPNEMESYELVQMAIRDMETTYIAQVPQTLVGTPFESTIDIVMDRVP